MTSDLANRYYLIHARIAASQLPGRPPALLLAVSKTQPATAIRALAGLGQRSFGENYVQEALGKQHELADLDLEWHCIGPLQSNKCREVAENFAWLQTLDREKLIAPLQRHRPPGFAPLNVLIQVNIDDESSKSGCTPAEIPTLAAKIANSPRLCLRGLMAIPRPQRDGEQQNSSFKFLHELFQTLQQTYASVDTLSMGMSDDFELAIATGSTLVRIGSALFGARHLRATNVASET